MLTGFINRDLPKRSSLREGAGGWTGVTGLISLFGWILCHLCRTACHRLWYLVQRDNIWLGLLRVRSLASHQDDAWTEGITAPAYVITRYQPSCLARRHKPSWRGGGEKVQVFFFYSQSILLPLGWGLRPRWGEKKGFHDSLTNSISKWIVPLTGRCVLSHVHILSLTPSWQSPWAMLRWRVINARWEGRKSIFRNLLFVSLTVVSISDTASLQEAWQLPLDSQLMSFMKTLLLFLEGLIRPRQAPLSALVP